MADSLRRLQNVRAVLRAVERRTQVHRELANGKLGDVLERLKANQCVRAAVRTLVFGDDSDMTAT